MWLNSWLASHETQNITGPMSLAPQIDHLGFRATLKNPVGKGVRCEGTARERHSSRDWLWHKRNDLWPRCVKDIYIKKRKTGERKGISNAVLYIWTRKTAKKNTVHGRKAKLQVIRQRQNLSNSRLNLTNYNYTDDYFVIFILCHCHFLVSDRVWLSSYLHAQTEHLAES